MMGMEDIAFLDIDELGVRPRGWNEEGLTGMDFDESSGEFYLAKKFYEFGPGKNDVYPSNSGSEDEVEYDIDPETGEKIFRETVIASCQSLSSSSPSNYHWVEEYLSTLATAPVTIPKRAALDFPSLESEFDWQRADPSFYPMEEKTSLQPPSSSQTFFMPMGHERLFSMSTDDEHSTSSGSQGRRYLSPIKDFDGHCLMSNESNILDGEIHFHGQLFRTKLEKIEPDEHSVPPMFVRRPSIRPQNQGQQDEELLRQANIPLTVRDITQSSTEEYNRHLARMNYLTAEQIHLIKDIRRRGKNKIAAQNCRKRKANSVEVLSEEVDELKRVKNGLEERKRVYQQQIDETRHQYEYLHRQVLPNRQLPPAIFVK